MTIMNIENNMVSLKYGFYLQISNKISAKSCSNHINKQPLNKFCHIPRLCIVMHDFMLFWSHNYSVTNEDQIYNSKQHKS